MIKGMVKSGYNLLRNNLLSAGSSLSECGIWDAKGGKSRAVFVMTRDKRMIIKEISKIEFDSFAGFGEQYLEYLSDSLETKKKTCLAKIFGIYKFTLGNKARFLMSKIYDLKENLQGRLSLDSAEVFLDQNLINNMMTSPLQISPNSLH